MRKVFLLATFFLATPCVLILAIVLLAWNTYSHNPNSQFFALPTSLPSHSIVYAAVPDAATQIAGGANVEDARVEKLAAFFHNYGSVLEQYAPDFVTNADTYSLDYRLLPAIAMQESIGCKREIAGTNNCWGWGIYKGKTTSFGSYSEAITTISKLIAKNYVGKGLNTPEEIQKLYNPSNTSDWSTKINYFMNQIQNTL